ncbi:hypothetical protein GGR70_003016 [Xanthomonas campestris]|nr:hypothetical protein [Xanthomonas campestris]
MRMVRALCRMALSNAIGALHDACECAALARHQAAMAQLARSGTAQPQ